MADSCASLAQPKQPIKSRLVKAPPLQVIGFNLSPNKPQLTELHQSFEVQLSSSTLHVISPRSATSPRSALQELLDQLPPNKSLLATSDPPTNQKLTVNPHPVLPRSPPSTNQKRAMHQPWQLYCASATTALQDTHRKSSISASDEPLVTQLSKNHKFRDDKLGGLKSLQNAQNSSIFNRSNIKGMSSRDKEKAMQVHNCLDQKSRRSNYVQEKSKKSSLFTFMAVSSSPSSASDRRSYWYHDDESNTANNKKMDFLNSCHLCKRFLGQGQDLFMYSVDKAFCSMECRYQQIMIDERNEQRPPPIIRSGPDHQSQDLNYNTSNLTMAHQYNYTTTSHYPKTAAAA